MNILILVGIPASGKSTFAKEFIETNVDYVRINRDDIIKMLRNSPMLNSKGEELVTEIEYSIAENALAKRMNIIWDNTHLKMSYINSIIKRFNDRANISFKIFDIDLNEAIRRDSLRESKVGEEVIKRMYANYINLIKDNELLDIPMNEYNKFLNISKNTELLDAVIFDIDGTLAFKGNRSHFDWNKVDIDHYSSIVGEHIEFHRSKGRKIILLTGRDSSSEEKTIKWLEDNNIYYDMLYFRNSGDQRKDFLIKKEIYDNYIKNNHNVHCVYDDRLQVVDMWYDEGIFCFNVNQGNKKF
jgi:predicted kinase/3-deoxy-D-manno-octulosonate 8-phosphate phosphatase KdsC-like HAD superfamily phosphatase